MVNYDNYLLVYVIMIGNVYFGVGGGYGSKLLNCGE